MGKTRRKTYSKTKKHSFISFLGSNKEKLFLLVIGLALVIFTITSKPTQLLSHTWRLSGNHTQVVASQMINPTMFIGKTAITITYNLHGTCLLSGDASTLEFMQNGWKTISLYDFGQNCKNGEQRVTIPLADFKDKVTGKSFAIGNPNVRLLQARFWNNAKFAIAISSLTLSATSTQVLATQNTSAQQTWPIQSIDAMKSTKDAVCYQHSDAWIDMWVTRAGELGANYVAISTPYDSPSCGDALAYTKKWIAIIRKHGLKVWHRDMPLAFEGIYSTPKSNASNFIDLITNYIKANPDEYENGDIFTPIPEPQNGGILGVTYCAQSICQFSSAQAFNAWLRNSMTASQNAFDSIGKTGVNIGYFGFDGFVTWGDHNPDWHGILDNATLQQMGNITIDHYPEVVNETMQQGLDTLQQKYPTFPIIIGEWGAVTGVNVDQQIQTDMGAAKTHNVIGFNYWQFGPGGSGEQLINSDFSSRSAFFAVQSFYKP